jgi:hypothetical protein
MLYELRGRTGPLDEARAELAQASAASVRAAYDEVESAERGEMIVGLSVDDYGPRLAPMLAALEGANAGDARYTGWAIHDFSEYVALRAPAR